MATNPVARGWSWFVEGLAEAYQWVRERSARRPTLVLELGRDGGALKGADGEILGHLTVAGDVPRLEPESAARSLAGAVVDVVVPKAWLFRRDLDPVAAESAPYLDAFVRHQIDTITPWRASDVHYAVRHGPLPRDPKLLFVEVGAIPKRLVQGLLAVLGSFNPKQIRLTAEGTEFRLAVHGAQDGGENGIRQPINIALIGFLVCVGGVLGWLRWENMAVGAEIEEQDGIIAERRNVLAAAARRDRAGQEGDTALLALRDANVRVTEVIDALSEALPDTAYVTELTIEKGQVRLTGITRNLPQLVPALENSGHFAKVAFTAATTRVESGTGDRFHLEMLAPQPQPAPKQP